MDRSNVQLSTILKQHGYSLTNPRQTVFDALKSKPPQTMAELIAICQCQVDRASVYRTITLFERLGIVHRILIGWKYKLELSDTFQEHHHHLTCLKCGSLVPLAEDSNLEQILRDMADNHGFLTQSHQLEISGLCIDCRTLK